MSIAAVLVNHNTSAFAELAIRSLFVHNPGPDMTLTVYDNGSTDDRSGMLAAAETYGAQVQQSGFPISTPGNSHGEVLRRFVLDPTNHRADHLLFLDAASASPGPEPSTPCSPSCPSTLMRSASRRACPGTANHRCRPS